MNSFRGFMKKAFVLEFVFRWFIGICFVFASVHKIADPAAFAKVVYGYGLFPNEVVNLIAVVVPFLELTAGIMLCMGICVRGASGVISMLLISFIVAISINLVLGREFDCGCFSIRNGGYTSPEELLVRDLFLLVCGLFLLLYEGERRWTWDWVRSRIRS